MRLNRTWVVIGVLVAAISAAGGAVAYARGGADSTSHDVSAAPTPSGDAARSAAVCAGSEPCADSAPPIEAELTCEEAQACDGPAAAECASDGVCKNAAGTAFACAPGTEPEVCRKARLGLNPCPAGADANCALPCVMTDGPVGSESSAPSGCPAPTCLPAPAPTADAEGRVPAIAPACGICGVAPDSPNTFACPKPPPCDAPAPEPVPNGTSSGSPTVACPVPCGIVEPQQAPGTGVRTMPAPSCPTPCVFAEPDQKPAIEPAPMPPCPIPCGIMPMEGEPPIACPPPPVCAAPQPMPPVNPGPETKPQMMPACPPPLPPDCSISSDGAIACPSGTGSSGSGSVGGGSGGSTGWVPPSAPTP